jgi:hypothetical protein
MRTLPMTWNFATVGGDFCFCREDKRALNHSYLSMYVPTLTWAHLRLLDHQKKRQTLIQTCLSLAVASDIVQ